MFVGLGCLAGAWSGQCVDVIGAWLGWPELGWGEAWSGFCGCARARALSLCVCTSMRLWVPSFFARLRKWFKVKITIENIFCPIALVLRSTLKTFSVWPNFPDQLNSLFYGKAFLKLVWSQNKHSLKGKSHYSFSKKYKNLSNLLEML